MASRKLAEDSSTPARRRPPPTSLPIPPAEPQLAIRDVLVRSWPGRLFIVAAALKLILIAARLLGELPGFLQVLSSTATLALVFVLLIFVWRLFVLVQRRLLWRVRRKLILSYIFIGVVPSLLIVGFFLLGGVTISMSVSAYLFRDGYEDVVRNAGILAEAAAVEIGRTPRTTRETIERVYRNGLRALDLPAIAIAFVPASGSAVEPIGLGWEHQSAPLAVPEWARSRAGGFTGAFAVARPDSAEPELVIRALRPAGTKPVGWVIVDVPLDGPMLDRLHETTSVKAESVFVPPAADGPANTLVPGQPSSFAPFGSGVAVLNAVDWQTGQTRLATVALSFRLGELYNRLSLAQSVRFSTLTLGEAFLLMLAFVAVLFLIIEIVALVMGLALARSITSSIHELFMGTERVRQGDFTHRIDVRTKDQLGELADSFNQMTGSIENLLQTAAEKKRMEEELRIARQIQMSLLPRGPVDMPGLSVTALCVPAREVGGDYYDFFPLGRDRLGVLIADVSGKGTSAALYMAELKGLVLSLSQICLSPRHLLLEVNRIISENLDSRSFITMTYAVIDMADGVMTYARAGHTPLIYLPGPAAADRDAQVLTPNGMVLGLRIDGAAEKFAELLEEDQIVLQKGDVIVLYTDGITEAMDPSSDLFGEARLSRIVQEHGHLESAELRERILREIEAFVGSADQHDDMTMILIKVERTGVAAARVAV
ncbi:MAG TPA: SpoIIE family protein phosphatase [Vicinamibacterales bacterium]|nr:SpoIIE family protein phosphatase [Vicinamibacterales bacterium]